MARTKPHVKVHLSVADHRKTSAVWADVRMRGMLIELWRKAGEKFAGRTGDRVSLKATDRMDIAGTTDQPEADRALTALCSDMKYELRRYPNRWEVKVRKFSKKQGYEDEERRTKLSDVGQELPPPNPNPNPIPKPIPNPNPIEREEPAPRGARAPHKSPEVAFPGGMAEQDWRELAERHRVDRFDLERIAGEWAAEKGTRYTAKGWRLAINRALRDRWAWTKILFAPVGGPIAQAERESPALAKERRQREHMREALRRSGVDPDAPALFALEGGRS